MPLSIHGDAAFAGQGVVAETLWLSRLRGYRTGDTVHVIITNRLDTPPHQSHRQDRKTPSAEKIWRMMTEMERP